MSALIGILNGKPVGDRLHSALDKLDPARIVRRDTRMFATHGAAAGLAAIGPELPDQLVTRPDVARPDARLIRLGQATLGIVGPAPAICRLGLGDGAVEPTPADLRRNIALAALLADLDRPGQDTELALRRLMDRTGGDMSFTLLIDEDPRRMFVARGETALCFAAGDHTGLVASDERLLSGADPVSVGLRPGDVATLSADRVRVADACGRVIARRIGPAARPADVPPMPAAGRDLTAHDLDHLARAVRLGAGLTAPDAAPLPVSAAAGIHGRISFSAAAPLMPAAAAAADLWRRCYGLEVLVRPIEDGARPYLPVDLAIILPDPADLAGGTDLPRRLRQGGARSVTMLVADAGASPVASGLDAVWRLPLPREYGVAPTLSALGLISGLAAIGSRIAALGNGAPRPRPGLHDAGIAPRVVARVLNATADRLATPQPAAFADAATAQIDRIAARMIASGQRRLDLELAGPVLDPRVSGGMAELACTLFAEIAQVICLPVQDGDPFGRPSSGAAAVRPLPAAPRLDPTTAIGAAAGSENATTAAGLAGAMVLAAAGAMRTAHAFARASGAALGRPRCLTGLRGS